MKNRLLKNLYLKICLVIVIITAFFAIFAVQTSAKEQSAGHLDPDKTTTTHYIYPAEECNRTIKVEMFDENGNWIRTIHFKTKRGVDCSFRLSIGGYDITKFSSNQGLWETCKMSWTTGGSGDYTYLDVNYYFRTAASKSTLEIRLDLRKWDKITVQAKHFTEGEVYNAFHRDAYNLHSTTSKQTVDYYTWINVPKISITGYHLREGYANVVYGNLCIVNMRRIHENCQHDELEYDYHGTSWSEDMPYVSKYDESKDGKLDWCNNRVFTISFLYDRDEYTISYNANGGTGAPASQIKHYGKTLVLTDDEPTRTGYTFLGWGTSATDTTVNYQPGNGYNENSAKTLYAIWRNDTTYTVTYNANGGTGAPASQTKQHDVGLTLSTTKPTRAGYTCIGWSTSRSATVSTYGAGGTYSGNANLYLYAVWKPATYTIKYNANGGSGYPASQTKTHGVNIVLSSIIPKKTGYDFMGWATSSSATTVTYQPGSTYSSNSPITLYAVWQKTNYEFSISTLTVSNQTPFKYENINVSVRVDSWDKINAYSQIPVTLYFDGKEMTTQFVDLAKYGYAQITFTINVGKNIGDKKIDVRVNWPNHNTETNPNNNQVEQYILVKEYDYEMEVSVIAPTDKYTEGTTVVTSFTVNNDSDFDIYPSSYNNLHFEAYYYDNGQKVVISNQRWNQFVIPNNAANLAYFKWTVPSDMAGKIVYCTCTANVDDRLNEENKSNNTDTYSTAIVAKIISQTPDTRYESEKPSSYKNTSSPANHLGKATWNQWVYTVNGFELKTYGIQFKNVSTVITPSESCTTAELVNGKWNIGSGYGFTLSYKPTIETATGCNTPSASAYTSIQSAIAKFPEFNYADATNKFRTLIKSGSEYLFAVNTDDVYHERIHFIPVWFNDGEYEINVTATQVWTPAGKIYASTSSNAFVIDGTMYDDFYVGG